MSDEKDKNPIRVFLVEDYHLMRMGLMSALVQFDTIDMVGEAVSGEQALESLSQLEVDVVLMDLGLPGIDGIETIKRLKASNTDIKIIVLTSHESEEEVQASLSAGAERFCVKDTQIEKLVEMIESVFQS